MIERAVMDFDREKLLSLFDAGPELARYFDLLMKENERINLVSRETSDSDLRKLAAESLVPFNSLKTSHFPRYLDIGSGGGFPAVIVLLMARAGVLSIKDSICMERRQRRAEALGRLVRQLKLSAVVIPSDFVPGVVEGKFDLITLRYVKLTPTLFRHITGSLSGTGCFVYYARPEFEIDPDQYDTTIQPFTLNGSEPVKNYTIVRKNC